MRPRAFVAMPFGTKEGIDFDAVYAKLIVPALTAAELDVVRADEDIRGGDIRTDMFQELLLADLVLAELTTSNANVWYELGVRHALRARGIVLIFQDGAVKPFDVYTDRKLRYTFNDGEPGKGDVAALTKMVKATMECWRGRKISPVYGLLPNLQEPDWKTLRIGDVREFWEKYEAWSERLEQARQRDQIGDVLMLADEAPVASFRAEAWIKAGSELCKHRRYKFALEQLERGLAVEPKHLKARRQKGICLQRLAMEGGPQDGLADARSHYRNILKDHPGDVETYALLGRLDKDKWVEAFRGGGSEAERKELARDKAGLLKAAIESYEAGYRRNPAHYYSGINALTLRHVQRHLRGETGKDRGLDDLAGAVRFAAQSEIDQLREQLEYDGLFWPLATLGDLEVIVGTGESVRDAYETAIGAVNRNWFALDSCRQQLLILADLDYNPANVRAGLDTLERAQNVIGKPAPRAEPWTPRKVFLFSGHMADAPGRDPPRFPAAMEPAAAREIARILDELEAGPQDLALTQGACGGDLLFSEACIARGLKLQWQQPFREPEFIQRSVVGPGERWRKRYFDAKQKVAVHRNAPDALGPVPGGTDEHYPFQRCNLWLLYTALSYGVDKVRFICLWNGVKGDGPGGTAHMLEEVNRRTGQVSRIDTNQLPTHGA